MEGDVTGFGVWTSRRRRKERNCARRITAPISRGGFAADKLKWNKLSRRVLQLKCEMQRFIDCSLSDNVRSPWADLYPRSPLSRQWSFHTVKCLRVPTKQTVIVWHFVLSFPHSLSRKSCCTSSMCFIFSVTTHTLDHWQFSYDG